MKYIWLISLLFICGCGDITNKELNNRIDGYIDAAMQNLLSRLNAKVVKLKTYNLLYAQACALAKEEYPEAIKVNCPRSGRQATEPLPSVPPTKVITKCDTQIMVRDQKANVFYEQEGQVYMGELEPNVSYQTSTNCVLSVDNSGN